jgi:hypothetical protein
VEELEVIWKEPLESRTHKDTPDCVDGGRSVRETSVIELTVPIQEEAEATIMRLGITISCAMRVRLEGGAQVVVEGARVPIPMSIIFL